MTTKKKAKQTVKDFENAMHDLESLVEAMESGELSLEESLAHFEKGIKQIRTCQQALNSAEQKVKILLKDVNDEQLVGFDGK